MKPSALVTVVFLCLVSLVHLIRVVMQVDLVVDTFVVPMWASVAAFLCVGTLAVWLWRQFEAKLPLKEITVSETHASRCTVLATARW